MRNKSPTSDDESGMCDSKLQPIQLKAEERRLKKVETLNSLDKVEQAAVCIQRMWKGYYTRNKNKEVQGMFKELQNQRAHEYIM